MRELNEINNDIIANLKAIIEIKNSTIESMNRGMCNERSMYAAKILNLIGIVEEMDETIKAMVEVERLRRRVVNDAVKLFWTFVVTAIIITIVAIALI